MELDAIIYLARAAAKRRNDTVWGGVGTTAMPTPKECRQHAEECLRLANETTQIYARQALLELAAEFRKIADELESRTSPSRAAKRRRTRPTAATQTRRRRAC
jgi:HEPN domain-containing protein